MSRFETEIPRARKNLNSSMNVPGQWMDRVRQRRSLDKLILDLNSSVSETYRRRERWPSPAAISRPVHCIVGPTIQWVCRHNDTTSILLIWSSQTMCKMTPFESGTCLRNPF